MNSYSILSTTVLCSIVLLDKEVVVEFSPVTVLQMHLSLSTVRYIDRVSGWCYLLALLTASH